MVRKSSIIPTDLSNSREYYGLNNSQDIYKGTSFKFSGEWVPNTHYFNDEYIVDFVTHIDEDTQEMAMWACSRNHLSSNSNEPCRNSRFWTFVMSGSVGQTGQVYVPFVNSNGELEFRLSSEPGNDVVKISSIKGDPGRDGIDGRDGKDGRNGLDGNDGKVYIPSVNNGVLTMTLSDPGRAEYRVNISDFKGDKGDPGKPIEVKITETSGIKYLWYRVEGSNNWIKVGEVGGQPGKNAKLTVWRDNNGDSRDDRIVWGYDGIPVSEWTTMCYLDELKGENGDEHIYIGTTAPEDTSMIWYDPSDSSCSSINAIDTLYEAYLQSPGKRVEVNGKFTNIYLEKDDFLKAIGNISPINGFEIRVKPNFESLGEASQDKLGYIYLIPSPNGSSDMYEEWIVVDTAETVVGEKTYAWEKWGASSVNLDNYYTNDQVDKQISNAINNFIASFNGGEIDSSYWN